MCLRKPQLRSQLKAKDEEQNDTQCSYSSFLPPFLRKQSLIYSLKLDLTYSIVSFNVLNVRRNVHFISQKLTKFWRNCSSTFPTSCSLPAPISNYRKGKAIKWSALFCKTSRKHEYSFWLGSTRLREYYNHAESCRI